MFLLFLLKQSDHCNHRRASATNSHYIDHHYKIIIKIFNLETSNQF